jgi:hypothetical protein
MAWCLMDKDNFPLFLYFYVCFWQFGEGTEAQPHVIRKKPHSLRFSSLSSLISVRSNDRLHESEGFRHSDEAVVSFLEITLMGGCFITSWCSVFRYVGWLRRYASSRTIAVSRPPMMSLKFFSCLILSDAPWLRGLLSLYQKWAPEDISGCKARPASKADNLDPPSMSRLPRHCRILDVSQPYRSPRPVTRTALLYSGWSTEPESFSYMCSAYRDDDVNEAADIH